MSKTENATTGTLVRAIVQRPVCQECGGSGEVEKTIIRDGEFEMDVMCECIFCNGTGVEE